MPELLESRAEPRERSEAELGEVIRDPWLDGADRAPLLLTPSLGLWGEPRVDLDRVQGTARGSSPASWGGR